MIHGNPLEAHCQSEGTLKVLINVRGVWIQNVPLKAGTDS